MSPWLRESIRCYFRLSIVFGPFSASADGADGARRDGFHNHPERTGHHFVVKVINVNPKSLGGLRSKRIADNERTLRSMSGCRVKVKPSVRLNLAKQKQEQAARLIWETCGSCLERACLGFFSATFRGALSMAGAVRNRWASCNRC